MRRKTKSAAGAFLAGACLVLLSAASPASAADSSGADSIRQQYQADRAACLSGRTGEDLQACLREAGAAAQAERRGQLEHQQENYRQNALARCAPLPPDEREACRLRVEGAGTVRGSVEGGGLYRELRIREPAPAESSSAVTATPPAAVAPTAPAPATSAPAGSPPASSAAPTVTVVPPTTPPPATVVAPAPAAPAAGATTRPAMPAASSGGGPTFTPVQPAVPGRAVPPSSGTSAPGAAPPPASSLQISPPATPVMQMPSAPQPALVAPGSVPQASSAPEPALVTPGSVPPGSAR